MPSDLMLFDVDCLIDDVRVRPAHGCSYLRSDITTGHLATKQLQTFPWILLWELYTVYKS